MTETGKPRLPPLPGSEAGWRGLLFDVRQPPSYADVLARHLPLAILAGGVLAAAALMPIEWMPIPGCTFRKLTGYPCAFCGFTRAFISLAHGRWMEALVNCPLAVPVFVLFGAAFAWNVVAVAARRCIFPGPAWRLARRPRIALFSALVAAVLLNWAYRIACGFK